VAAGHAFMTTFCHLVQTILQETRASSFKQTRRTPCQSDALC
jgi:hypothetical protein